MIRGLVAGLQRRDHPSLAAAIAVRGEEARTVAVDAAVLHEPVPSDEEIAAFLSDTANPERADVVVFAGYLGPTLTNDVDPTGKDHWRLLYQDPQAMSWLLVPETDIVLHHRQEDRRAAFGLLDLIWVRADAPVRQGNENESLQARFLIGTFTAAADLHTSLSDAGTLSPASGILCAPTPECCMRHSR